MIGLIFLAFVAAFSLTSIAAGALADRMRKKLLMALGCCLLAVSFPLVGLTTQTWSLVLAILFIGISIAIALTPTLPEISEYLQHIGQIGSQAQGYALFNLAWGAGSCVGGIVSGIMYDGIGFLNTMIVMASVSAAFASFLLAYCYFVNDFVATGRKDALGQEQVEKQAQAEPAADAEIDAQLHEANNLHSTFHIAQPTVTHR
jgi:MFS family permease